MNTQKIRGACAYYDFSFSLFLVVVIVPAPTPAILGEHRCRNGEPGAHPDDTVVPGRVEGRVFSAICKGRRTYTGGIQLVGRCGPSGPLHTIWLCVLLENLR